MSYNMTDNSDFQADLAGVVLFGGLAVYLLWSLSQALGADFGVTVHAVTQSIVILVVAVGIAYFLIPSLSLLMIGTVIVLWPAWWDVLHSIAMGGADPATDFRGPWNPTQWYESNVFLFASELCLIAGWVGTWMYRHRRGF